ncbi:hypothetical protein [Aquisphaera insulae]|uniref:hypothetical protein n=1 Tax=Aquisphaera insulae TaxID=2712864 RepID=UPI0013EA8CC1|nr:hypothetical protein [Aquisphaera insulae]
MRLENLIPYIVPLTFVAIWALTSLLNRDPQPLPPRPGRPAGPRMGPGPGLGSGPGGMAAPPGRPAVGPAPARPASGPGRLVEPSSGWRTIDPDLRGQTPRRLPTRPTPGSPDDAIVYLENDPTGRKPASRPLTPGPAGSPSITPARSPRPGQGRRGARPRSTGGDSGRPREPETHRALSDQLQESLSRKKNRPLEIAPLTPLSQPLTEPSGAAATSPSPLPASGVGRPAQPILSGEQIRAMLASPMRLREVTVLAEILQPPVSLRPRRPPL